MNRRSYCNFTNERFFMADGVPSTDQPPTQWDRDIGAGGPDR